MALGRRSSLGLSSFGQKLLCFEPKIKKMPGISRNDSEPKPFFANLAFWGSSTLHSPGWVGVSPWAVGADHSRSAAVSRTPAASRPLECQELSTEWAALGPRDGPQHFVRPKNGRSKNGGLPALAGSLARLIMISRRDGMTLSKCLMIGMVMKCGETVLQKL